MIGGLLLGLGPWFAQEPLAIEPIVELARLDVQVEGAPPGLSLRLVGPDGAVTELLANSDGHAVIEGLAPGVVMLVAEAPGHSPLHQELSLVGGEALSLRFTLLRLAAGAAEDDVGATIITVAAPRQPEQTRRSLSAREARSQPGTGGDPVRALQSLPGVARAPFSVGSLVVRGTGPDDSGFYLGGAPIPAVYHFGGLCTVVNADTLSSIELLPGAFSVRYGGHLGGVVNLAFDEDTPTDPSGYLAIDLYQSSLFAQTPLGRPGTALTLTARRSYVDAVLMPLFDQGVNGIAVQLPVYHDGLLRLQGRSDAGVETDLIFVQATDKASIEQPGLDGSITSALTQESRRLWAQLRSPRQRAARGTLTAWAGPTTREMVFIEDDGARESIQQVGLRAELSRVPGDDTPIGFLLGVEGRSEQVALTYDTDDGVTSSLGFGDNYEYGYGLVDRLGLYAEERQRLGDWELNPGIRLDYTAAGLHESLSVDPRLGLRWNLNDQAALIGGIGQYSQPPAPRELLTTWANPDLEPERALTLTLGWRQRLSDRGDLEITAYRSQLDALIVGHEDRLELAFVLPPSMEADIGDYTNEGNGTTMGVEAMARWMSDPWEGWLGLSASRSLRTGRDGIERAFAYDQPLLSTLVVHRALPRRASLGLRLRAGAGNPYPQVTGRIWSIDAMQYLGVSEGQGRLPPVFTADLRADKAWALRRFTLTAYLDLLNATNRQNVEMLNYTEDYTEEVFVYGLPIFPAFGLRGDW